MEHSASHLPYGVPRFYWTFHLRHPIGSSPKLEKVTSLSWRPSIDSVLRTEACLSPHAIKTKFSLAKVRVSQRCWRIIYVNCFYKILPYLNCSLLLPMGSICVAGSFLFTLHRFKTFSHHLIALRKYFQIINKMFTKNKAEHKNLIKIKLHILHEIFRTFLGIS